MNISIKLKDDGLWHVKIDEKVGSKRLYRTWFRFATMTAAIDYIQDHVQVNDFLRDTVRVEEAIAA